jgi:protein-tyrosine phosphatase
MLDLHCHILPGVDDGAASLEESLAMGRFCAQDGISHVVATPHCHRHCRLLRADILPRVDRLNDSLAQAGIPLVILPGSEIQATDTDIYRREFEAGSYCHLGDGSSFSLLEFNWDERLYPPDAQELVRWIRERGMTPIIAHPERHGFFTANPQRLEQLIQAGALLQITVDSLLGNHGPASQAAGETLLETFRDAVLATDAHNVVRCSGLSVGYLWVRQHVGDSRAVDLQARADHILASLHPPRD